jgi:small subunit ribosomal protein S6
MKRYETLFIADPDLPEDTRTALFDRLRELITAGGGFIAAFDEWGLRKLAYIVKRKKRGYYALLDYCAAGKVVQELERVMRIDDRVIRFLTVVKDEDVNVDALREELERKAAQPEPEAELGEGAAKDAGDEESGVEDMDAEDDEEMEEEEN